MENSKNRSILNEINRDLENVLTSKTHEVDRILKKFFLKVFFRQCLKVMLALITFYGIVCIPSIHENICAIGRIAITTFAPPFLNFESFSNKRCLIQTYSTDNQLNHMDQSNGNSYARNIKQCGVCENLVEIDRQSNISSELLQNAYISRDIPVIISPSHEPLLQPIFGNESNNFISFLRTLPNFSNTIPCNTFTNLHSSSVILKHLLNRIEQNVLPNWILQFRLCDFESIKATRSIFPVAKRPNYIPKYWPPFKASWFLISYFYESAMLKEIPLDGLAIVFQLKGTLNGMLRMSDECSHFCSDQEFQLAEGEALILSSKMWKLNYNSIRQFDGMITFIQEIEIN